MKSRLNTSLLLAALCLVPFTAHAALKSFYESSAIDAVDGRANLGLFLFIHDQVSPAERAELGDGYLNWFLAHLEEVTGRRTTVTIVTEKPGYTDFNYRQNDQQKLLREWRNVTYRYAKENNLPAASDRHKYILLASRKIDGLTHGLSAPELNIAIASMKMYHTLGHEIGHLLGANHEAAKGFPCQTIMWGNSLTTINPCYYFSKANQDNIRNFLKNVP